MNARLTLVLIPLLGAGCTDLETYQGMLAVPTAAAVSAEGAELPFNEPIGYVVSQVGGEIHPLALKQGRFLSDQATGSFVRGNPLPTGRKRTISSMSVWSPEPDRMSVFVTDQAYSQLLEVPHILAVQDGVPVPATPAWREPVSSGAGTLSDLRLSPGITTTEDWELTWRAGEWWVEGSRSGRLSVRAQPDELYVDDEVGLQFRVTAGLQELETIRFSTVTGIREYDLGTPPIAVQVMPDQELLAVALSDPDTRGGEVVWFDPHAGREEAVVVLGEHSRPTHFAIGAGDLWIADAGEAAIWRVAQGATKADRFDLPWPVSYVAVGDRWNRAFVVPIGSSQIWSVDLQTGSLIDLNPWSPGVDGVAVDATIRGIAAMPDASNYPFPTEDGEIRRGHLIAISVANGAIVFMDQRTGCLLPDRLGPRSSSGGFGSFADHTADFSGVAGAPSLVRNATNDRHILINRCPGIALNERWEVRYSAPDQGWVVKGERSGLQSRLAYEDQRYTTDRGELSFVIRSGTSPSIDGWLIEFNVTDGILRIDSDDGDVQDFDFFRRQMRQVRFRLPGQPATTSVIEATGIPGWERVTPTSYAIVPIEGSNSVAKVLPDTAEAERLWR
ncbi:MAG: hypothetical protein EA397_19545 [Deltaproteobacteria bacterium]|nr:MAG: hypothetical protein EA397_19545 [Deltaproteobacteria bacterium]